MLQRTLKSDGGRTNQVVSLPNYPIVPPRNRTRVTDEGAVSTGRIIENPLEDRGSAAVRLDFRTRRNIQRNILPDIVCDSVLSGFRRFNADVRENKVTVPVQESLNDAPVVPEEPSLNTTPASFTLETNMGQRISNPQKPNISFAWVLRGDSNSSSSSTTSSSSYASSVYQPSSVSRQFTWGEHKRRQQCKSRKHHLFNEKNLKGSDLDDYRITRKTLFETSKCNNNNNNNLPIDIDRLSLSTAETTTSISKCVDKATNLKKKRYRSKTRINEGNLVNNNNVNSNDKNGNEASERIKCKHQDPIIQVNHVKMPGVNCDTYEFDEYLKKCSLLCPANLPMVLVSDTIMYQTRIGYQTEIFLPLGTLVNGIFSVQDWIYIQLPGKVDHSGYVIASSCIPMGILPKRHRSLHRPRQTLQATQTTSKSTDNLNLLLKPKSTTEPLNGTQFEALYARVIDKLKTSQEPVRKYSLSAQNLQKFNVLSDEALLNTCMHKNKKNDSHERNLDSISLK